MTLVDLIIDDLTTRTEIGRNFPLFVLNRPISILHLMD